MDAFSINDQLVEGCYDVLIVDDLYDTGATLRAVTNILYKQAKVKDVYVLAISKTRSSK